MSAAETKDVCFAHIVEVEVVVGEGLQVVGSMRVHDGSLNRGRPPKRKWRLCRANCASHERSVPKFLLRSSSGEEWYDCGLLPLNAPGFTV